jgi:hypothetical protein
MSPKTKTVFLILLCFALGVVVGFVAERYYLSSRLPHRPDFAQVRKEFAERLHLDTLQLSQVDSLMDSHRKKMDDIRKLFSAERDTLRSGIRKLLDPGQKSMYEDYIKEIEARDAKRHEGDRPPSK